MLALRPAVVFDLEADFDEVEETEEDGVSADDGPEVDNTDEFIEELLLFFGRPVLLLRENKHRRPFNRQASQLPRPLFSDELGSHRIFRSWHSSQAILN